MKLNLHSQYLLCLALILYFTNQAYCQENFQSGYIITIEGDTLPGTIDFRGWVKNPEVIAFHQNGEAIQKDCYPQTIRGFFVADEFYESATVEVETSPFKLPNLSSDAKISTQIETVFLLQVIQGSKNLYHLKNIDGKDNFYLKIDGEIKYLPYKQYLVLENGKKIIKENNNYKGLLAYYLKECNSDVLELNNVKYNQKSLQNLYERYYNCTQASVDTNKERDKIKTRLGLIAGLTITDLKFKGSKYDYFEDTNYSVSLNFTGGISIDFILPGHLRKWSIYNELTYSAFETSGDHNEIVSDYVYYYTSTSFDYSYLKLNNQLRFTYPFQKVNIFANAGISNGYAIKAFNNYVYEYRYYSETKRTEGPALEFARKHEQGLLFGTGIQAYGFSLETRYERGNGMSQYAKLGSIPNRIIFLLGYQF